MIPPKPPSRPDDASLLHRWRLSRRNLFEGLTDRLYGAWLAEVRTPFYRSFLANQPDLVRRVLIERPGDFPKSPIIADALRELLGDSVFVANGETWARQRRIIDPAFEGGRLRAVFPEMRAAAARAAERLAGPAADGRVVDLEPETSHFAADVIFRALFSMPIEAEDATRVFRAFRAYQSAAPLMNVFALMRAPRWWPRLRRRAEVARGREIRALMRALVERRAAEIAAGTAPADLATAIMTTPDSETGRVFGPEEMLDQVAIFFLAGHETSASALAWALWLLAAHPRAQERVADEATAVGADPGFGEVKRLAFARDVFREALRLYPPVPIMVREAVRPERMRDRAAPRGSLVMISPWHLHRHRRLWEEPDVFDPDRWATANGRERARDAYIPFSAGPRVCPGAGFAMLEGTLALAEFVRRFRFETVPEAPPKPVMQLTVRSETGIRVRLRAR